MRIVSWNINGVRKSVNKDAFRDILARLQADIICFQEIKSSRVALDRDIAVPDPFHAFFSFPATKCGYSGVAVYTHARTATPHKAEEGLSGTKSPERISHSYPSPRELDISPSDLLALDAEGRALVLDFGLFVLINVYCPNETSDARLPFKLNYHALLQHRVDTLISEGRQVIVLGDINVCAAPLDHCDGHLASNAATFLDHPARAWFHSWLAPNGCMVDVVRSFWPDRKGMYTCWNTKISARDSNYGTRVDYILVTQGLLPWVKHGDIQPFLKGSDHCPIFIDLHDEITTPTGQTLSLHHMMAPHAEPPRLAARYWDEFSGKQTLLSSFFTKGEKITGDSTTTHCDSQPPGSPSPYSSQSHAILSIDTAPQFPADAVPPDLAHRVEDPDLGSEFPSLPFLTSATGPPLQSPTHSPRTTLSPSEQLSSSSRDVPETSSLKRVAPLKRTSTHCDPPAIKPTKKQQRQRKVKATVVPGSHARSPSPGSGQRTLAAFFRPHHHRRLPTQSKSPPPPAPSASHSGGRTSSEGDRATDYCIESDYQLALQLASSQEAEPLPLSLTSSATGDGSSSSSANSKAAWSQLMAPIQPPKCTVHGEPAKEYTVNKPGPNKGKTFFICSRPVGPGYDKGKGERPREEVDHRYRCSFFKWSADVRREALKKRGEHRS